MKFKALKFKKTGEYASIEGFNGRYEVNTHGLPNPMPMTATLEELKSYYENYGVIVEDMNWDDYEMITLECNEIKE